MFSRWRERLQHTLGFRLALWYAGVFVASALATTVLAYVLVALSLRQYDRQMIQTTLVQYASAYARGGVDALAREIQRSQATGTEGPIFVRTLGVRQDLVFLSMPDAWRRFDLSQLASPPLTGEQMWAALDTGEGDRLEVASVRLPDGTLFQVGKSTERRRELLARFRRVLLMLFGSIALVGLAGGTLVTWSALQPAHALAATVHQILRTGRTDARVPISDSTDALGQLGILFNAMLDRIDAVVAGMRGALDNVAHDLRTPLTRLRSIAENTLQSNDPAALRAGLAECVEESDRVAGMLSTLMDISEAETGTMQLELGPVNLAELARQTRDLYEDLAEDRGVVLETNELQDVWVRGDRRRLRQVLANLVDNAVKYTPSGGRISLRTLVNGNTAVVSVTDTGLGIAPEELPHIWERLYRGDKSRSERGLGLGLSLVKAIVEAHGGQARVTSKPRLGTTVELRLASTPHADSESRNAEFGTRPDSELGIPN
jgi:signal transduction histidine kinase